MDLAFTINSNTPGRPKQAPQSQSRLSSPPGTQLAISVPGTQARPPSGLGMGRYSKQSHLHQVAGTLSWIFDEESAGTKGRGIASASKLW